MAPVQHGADRRSRSCAVYPVAGRDGRRVGGAAAHTRSHGRIGIVAGPARYPAAAATGRGPHLRSRDPPARTASGRGDPAPARRQHAQGPRPARAAARPDRAARPRPDSRPAAAGQLTPEATMETFQNTVTIRRPQVEVFAFLADFQNVPSWNYAIEQTTK